MPTGIPSYLGWVPETGQKFFVPGRHFFCSFSSFPVSYGFGFSGLFLAFCLKTVFIAELKDNGLIALFNHLGRCPADAQNSGRHQPCTSSAVHVIGRVCHQPCTSSAVHCAHHQPCTSSAVHIISHVRHQPCTSSALHMTFWPGRSLSALLHRSTLTLPLFLGGLSPGSLLWSLCLARRRMGTLGTSASAVTLGRLPHPTEDISS